MGAKKYDVEQQAAIAAGWEKSGLTQEAWAKNHGITSRTLRLYLRRHRPARHWNDELQAVVARATQALTAITTAMGKTALEPAAATPRKKFSFDD